MKKVFEHRALTTNLSSKCRWQELKDLFQPCGGIIYVTAHKIRNTGTIQFNNKHSLLKAVQKYNGVVIHDRPIRLVIENERKAYANRLERTHTSKEVQKCTSTDFASKSEKTFSSLTDQSNSLTK